jgi:hypothetical protein
MKMGTIRSPWRYDAAACPKDYVRPLCQAAARFAPRGRMICLDTTARDKERAPRLRRATYDPSGNVRVGLLALADF